VGRPLEEALTVLDIEAAARAQANNAQRTTAESSMADVLMGHVGAGRLARAQPPHQQL
jgi:hypothetical protein